jgi:hypothetical protein
MLHLTNIRYAHI